VIDSYPLSLDDTSTTNSLRNKLLRSSTKCSLKTKNKKDSSFLKGHNNKLINEEQDILFTYKSFLRDSDYDIISFSDLSYALNYIKELYPKKKF
jgi:hypothetical protein